MKNKIAEQRLINAIFTIGKEEYEKEIEVQEGLEEHNLAIEENEEYDEFYEYESYMEDVEFYKWYKEIEKDEDNALVLWGHILLYLGVENPQGRIIVDILKDMEEVRDIISYDKLLDEFNKYYKFFSTFLN